MIKIPKIDPVFAVFFGAGLVMFTNLFFFGVGTASAETTLMYDKKFTAITAKTYFNQFTNPSKIGNSQSDPTTISVGANEDKRQSYMATFGNLGYVPNGIFFTIDIKKTSTASYEGTPNVSLWILPADQDWDADEWLGSSTGYGACEVGKIVRDFPMHDDTGWYRYWFYYEDTADNPCVSQYYSHYGFGSGYVYFYLAITSYEDGGHSAGTVSLSNFDAYVAFDPSITPVETYPDTCTYTTNPLTACFWKNLFIPTEASFSTSQYLSMVNNLHEKAPFYYFFDLTNRIQNLNVENVNSFTQTINWPLKDVNGDTDSNVVMPITLMEASGDFHDAWQTYVIPFLKVIIYTAGAFVLMEIFHRYYRNL